MTPPSFGNFSSHSLGTSPIFLSFVPSAFVICSPLFGADVASLWVYGTSVEQYAAPGGTAKSSVTAQVEHLKKWLKQHIV